MTYMFSVRVEFLIVRLTINFIYCGQEFCFSNVWGIWVNSAFCTVFLARVVVLGGERKLSIAVVFMFAKGVDINLFVIPAKARIQQSAVRREYLFKRLDTGLRRYDDRGFIPR
jgi:hypothetical protein